MTDTTFGPISGTITDTPPGPVLQIDAHGSILEIDWWRLLTLLDTGRSTFDMRLRREGGAWHTFRGELDEDRAPANTLEWLQENTSSVQLGDRSEQRRQHQAPRQGSLRRRVRTCFRCEKVEPMGEPT